MSTPQFDFSTPAARANPYTLYAEMRETAPVHRFDTGLVAVSRYEDVRFVLEHPELFSSTAMMAVFMQGLGVGGVSLGSNASAAPGPETMQQLLKLSQSLPFDLVEFMQSRSVITTDPPQHDAIRSIVNRGFTPRRIQALEPRVRAITDETIATILAKGEADLVADLTAVLPVAVIAEMLGIEPERRADFKRWSDAIIAGATGSLAGTRPDWMLAALRDLAAYLHEAIERRRREPGDDLLSTILRAEAGEVGLTPLEVLLFALLLLVAGNETTTNLIGNAVAALLAHEGELEKVRSDPSLVPSLVEETLRYDSPIQMLFRGTTRELELADTKLPAGAMVMPIFASANRDPAQFENPDRFDVQRNPRGHLAFGFGIHFCLGAALARLEACTALEAIVTRLPNLQPLDPEIEYLDSFVLRGPRQLRVRLS